MLPCLLPLVLSMRYLTNFGEIPPNIIAWSSSVTVREKPEQGKGLDPLIDGEDHNPRLQKIEI